MAFFYFNGSQYTKNRKDAQQVVGLEPTHTSIVSPVLRSGIMALLAVIFSVKAWQVVGLEPTHTSMSPVLRSDIMALPAVSSFTLQR